MSAIYYLYIIRTQNNSLYTGITTDPQRRLFEHQEGKGARALRGKGPLTLVFTQEIGSKSVALQLEYAIKQLKKSEKEALIINPEPHIAALLSSLLPNESLH